MSRPIALSILAGIQFVAAGAVCIVLLGERSLDSELSPADIGVAIAAALVGAVVIGSTLNGGRIGWAFQVVLAVGAAGVGAWRVAEGDLPVLLVAALAWLAIVLVPVHRRWFAETRFT